MTYLLLSNLMSLIVGVAWLLSARTNRKLVERVNRLQRENDYLLALREFDRVERQRLRSGSYRGEGHEDVRPIIPMPPPTPYYE